MLGDPCLHYRDNVYDIFAGNTPDFKKSVHNLYSKFPTFRTYVNEEYYYGDDAKPLSDRILEHVQELIANFISETKQHCDMSGGKYLTYTHYYLYYAYNARELVPKVAGGVTIC